jgi:hypothetical protein
VTRVRRFAINEAVVDLEKHSEAEGIPRRTRRRLWILSALVSLACLAVLVGVWVRVYTAPPAPDPADTVVTTPDEATRYLEALVPAPEPGSEPPVYVPTGLYIESVQFKGPYNVQVSGYVWQRYADDLPQGIDKGFAMPEAEYARVEEVYRAQQGDEELIGWSFKATLREQFDYDRYPLDRQQIWILLWHADFGRNVYLEPDLGAYTSLDPAALPGVDTDFVLENWHLEESFFSYRANRYNTDFGVRGYVADEKQPELYFNVSIQRHLLSAVVSRMVVPLVILVQLFVIVMVIGTDRDRLEQFGVRPGGVIFTCAAFFFAVLVAQTSLRGEVQAGGLVYLESLYVLTYFVILAVAINSVLLVARPNLKLFRRYDNLWAEVLYWPAILLTLVVITFLTLS